MSKFVVLAALTLAGFTASAAACDWNREASNKSTVVAACQGSDCKAEATPQEPTAAQQESSGTSGISTERATEESRTPIVVACTGSNC